MDEDRFNMELRKFLKEVGVTSQREVEQVVRGVWDAGYKGTGNWPFNVACAHARGLSGFVTRLRSLTEAERAVVVRYLRAAVADGAVQGGRIRLVMTLTSPDAPDLHHTVERTVEFE